MKIIKEAHPGYWFALAITLLCGIVSYSYLRDFANAKESDVRLESRIDDVNDIATQAIKENQQTREEFLIKYTQTSNDVQWIRKSMEDNNIKPRP